MPFDLLARAAVTSRFFLVPPYNVDDIFDHLLVDFEALLFGMGGTRTALDCVRVARLRSLVRSSAVPRSHTRIWIAFDGFATRGHRIYYRSVDAACGEQDLVTARARNEYLLTQDACPLRLHGVCSRAVPCPACSTLPGAQYYQEDTALLASQVMLPTTAGNNARTHLGMRYGLVPHSFGRWEA